MRVFIVLCLVAAACADHLGYNYQPVDHSSDGLSFIPGGNYGAASNNHPSNTAPSGDATFGGQESPAFGGQGAEDSPLIDIRGGFGGPGSSLSPESAGQPTSGSPAFAEPQGELDKEFYTYSANDDDFNDPAASNQLANAVKQGLRVVFIKGPENKGLEDAALNLAKQAANQHTDIYVLNKQADIGDLANKLNNINKNANNKPDVHFVKYRTSEDAANAQRAIQGQYDSLAGPSQNINGGNAPVLNFASQAPVAVPAASAPRNNYLPASLFRF